jgi:hypothetical protein
MTRSKIDECNRDIFAIKLCDDQSVNMGIPPGYGLTEPQVLAEERLAWQTGNS